MNNQLIVPISHENESRKSVFDGAGFIVNLFDDCVFVSCLHNITNNEGKTHFIIVGDKKIKIDPMADNYFSSPPKSPMPVKNSQGIYESRVDDYLFIVLSKKYPDLIQLGNSKIIGIDAELYLHTFHKDGAKAVIKVKRKNSDDYGTVYPDPNSFDFSIRCDNLMEIDSNDLKNGFSGGPVFHGHICIGMLQSGPKDKVEGKIKYGSVLTAESIEERYQILKRR